jgi:tetratricopeptide (TPR) repeat protein
MDAWLTVVPVLGLTAAGALMALVLALSRKGRTEDEARAYLAGFRYVLSDDPDAAIAELARAAQLNKQTLETYFALGALFRRKGDLDRAIRLHQNMLLRPGLMPEVRRRALIALAVDYRRSGLSGRAQEELEKVLSEEPAEREALVQLRQIHEDAGQWERAAELQARLVEMDGQGQAILAHHLAEHSRPKRSSAPEEALAEARRAVELCPSSADAQLALGEALLSLSPGGGGARGAGEGGGPGAGAHAEGAAAAGAGGGGRRAGGAVARAGGFGRGAGRAVRAGAGGPAPGARRGRPGHRAPEGGGGAQAAVLGDAQGTRRALAGPENRSEEVRAEYAELLGALGQPPLVLRDHMSEGPIGGAWG